MNRYFIKLAYNGANYHGWQVQKNAHTVQAELNQKLGLILKIEINVIGCGRTDTGVHASEFYAHFEIDRELDDTKDLIYKLNSFLPTDIALYDIYKVNSDMHSRFSARKRTYKYFVSTMKTPFKNEFSYTFLPQLDVEAMNKAAMYLHGYKDFTSFSKTHTQTATNFCDIYSAHWDIEDDMLVFTISADRFLRNMVRAIVGTLMEIGIKKLNAYDILKIIEAKDRRSAGFSVPAKGLFLYSVKY